MPVVSVDQLGTDSKAKQIERLQTSNTGNSSKARQTALTVKMFRCITWSFPDEQLVLFLLPVLSSFQDGHQKWRLHWISRMLAMNHTDTGVRGADRKDTQSDQNIHARLSRKWWIRNPAEFRRTSTVGKTFSNYAGGTLVTIFKQQNRTTVNDT